MLIEEFINHLIVLDHHADIIVFTHLGMVLNEDDRQDDHHNQEDYRHYRHMILFLHQKGGQGDSHIYGVWALWVAKLLAFLLGFRVRQTLVSLGDQNEMGGWLVIPLIPIRVID